MATVMPFVGRANGDEMCSEDADHFGWYRGIVTKCATEADKKKTLVSMCAHVKFRNSETDGVLPVYHGRPNFDLPTLENTFFQNTCLNA